MKSPPILRNKGYRQQSIFQPENLVREGRRQKQVTDGPIPALNILDPDGDILRHLIATGVAAKSEHWPCYHSDLYEFERAGQIIGIIGCAVGAPYAVLLAEQIFSCGARLIVSITSSGQLQSLGPTPYFVVVERALRDEGTSYHYLEPTDFIEADSALIDIAYSLLCNAGPRVFRGATWTTDAPFRETESMLAEGRALGLAAIEMECAALYALARAKGYPVLCLAHVTNTMAVSGDDFEKGEAHGALEALALIDVLAANVPDLTEF